jgi:hypothetical protein
MQPRTSFVRTAPQLQTITNNQAVLFATAAACSAAASSSPDKQQAPTKRERDGPQQSSRQRQSSGSRLVGDCQKLQHPSSSLTFYQKNRRRIAPPGKRKKHTRTSYHPDCSVPMMGLFVPAVEER